MDIKQLLHESILAAANQAIADGVISAAQLPAVFLEVPPQKELCHEFCHADCSGCKSESPCYRIGIS